MIRLARLLAIALAATPSVRAQTEFAPSDVPTAAPSEESTCFETRGGCFSAGFIDNLGTAEYCQAACLFRTACNYFSYHPKRGDKRCHFCSDDRDSTQCTSPNPPERFKDCSWDPEFCPGDEDDEPTPMELLDEAVAVAARFCAGAPRADDDLFYETLALNAIVAEWSEGVYDDDETFSVASAVPTAAEILQGGCARATIEEPCTYTPLLSYCGVNGRTLCDASTLCTGTGCSYDATYQWTNEECPCT